MKKVRMGQAVIVVLNWVKYRFSLNKVFHPAFICSNWAKKQHQQKALEMCQIYSKLTVKTVASIAGFDHILQFILLLLLLNCNK